MRNLPITDPVWIKENVTVESSTKYFNSKFFHTVRLTIPYMKELYYKSNVYNREYNGYNILWDERTGEFFKFKSFEDIEFKQYLLRILLENNMISNSLILPNHYCNITISFDTKSDYWLRKYEGNVSLDDLINNFLVEENIDIKSLGANMKSIFINNIRQNVKSAIKNDGEKVTSYYILNMMTDNDLYCDEDTIRNILSTMNHITENESKIQERLKKSRDSIFVKYLLLRTDMPFSGVHKVSFFRYNSNEKKNTFDMVEIQINMLSDQKNNLNFIKNNAEKVKGILESILYSHSRIKKYANFLKLYSFILTKENTLVARFCFKENLEELLCEEDD